MHKPWLRGAGDILKELFTYIILKMTIKDHSDRKKFILCLELNWSKWSLKPLWSGDCRECSGFQTFF